LTARPRSRPADPHLPEATIDRERCFDEGSRALPEILWSQAEFIQAWEKYAAQGYGAEHAEDDYVRLACLEGRPGAAEALERVYLKPLLLAVAPICRTHEATAVAMQALREKLLLPPTARLRGFRAPGNFRAWLKVLAVRTALDVARKLGVEASREVELDERLEALISGPEEQCLRAELRQVVREGLRAAIRALPERERYALRMHLVAGWNITQIGRVFAVHRGTAARWLVSAKEQLRDLLSAELAQRLGTSPSEGAKLLENLPSRLELSLSSVFVTTGVVSRS
jgi:RNA polymerase sigma-70 factor (ECF subfamily)